MFDKKNFSIILNKIVNLNYESITEFAQKASFDRSYISKYINLKLDNPPSPEILRKIAECSNNITSYIELLNICGYLNLKDFFLHTQNNEQTNLYSLNKEAMLNIGFNIEDINQISLLSQSLHGTNIKEIEKILGKYSKEVIDSFFDIVITQSMGLLTLFNNTSQYDTDKKKYTRIPVLGNIPAGIPIELIEDNLGYEDISEDMLKGGKEYFAVKVQGNSMEPQYLDGDVLIVLKQNSCENKQDCIVMVNGDDGTFKRVFISDNGITLQPLNNEYMPVFYTNKEVIEKPVRILGVVKEIRRSV